MEKKTCFHVTFYPTFLYCLVIASVGYFLLAFGSGYSSSDIISSVLGYFACIVSLLFWYRYIKKTFKLEVNKEGIITYNSYGQHKNIKWDNVKSVKFLNFLFIKYLRVFYGESDSFDLPLFLESLPELKNIIDELSPEGNAVKVFFNTYSV